MNSKQYKTCSFFGHRNAELNDEQVEKLKSTIEDLITKKNVKTFLFGSRSNFDSLCHKIVTILKIKYPFIIRKCYTCKNETCVLEKEKSYWEDIYSHIYKHKVELLCVEEEVEHKFKWSSGKASYVERNQAMINDSDYCIFYYTKDYQPYIRKHNKHSISYYQPNSGTALAFTYANQKSKNIINIS